MTMEDWKRGTSGKCQLAYSIASLLTTPFLLISIVLADPVLWVTEKHELPFDTLLFIGLAEFLKICWTLWLFPTKDASDLETETSELGHGGTGTDGEKFTSRMGLPTFTKDTKGFPARTTSKTKTSTLSKLIEMFYGISGFVGSLFICHLVLVLFGAPVIQDWMLTLQFSFILVSWLFFPLCLVLPPATILPELVYISLWDEGCLLMGKWRFLVTCICTCMGSIVVPLDWDRPWQKWPIPCLLAATASQILINFAILLYFLPIIFNFRIRNFGFKRSVNRAKTL